MKINKIYLPLIIFTGIAIGFVMGAVFSKFVPIEVLQTKNSSKQKLNTLIDFIDTRYVDKVNTDSIVGQTVTQILEKLDPHSVYLGKNDAQAEAQSMKGDFVGIGVNFFMENDTLVVINPIKNGPSDKAGIKAGDRILVADKIKLSGKKINSDKITAILKGQANSKVVLTVYRKAEHKKIAITVIRNTIAIKSVDAVLMLNKTTGYIKVNRFAATTFAEFKKGLTQIIKQGANTLVLDLRDNGGGYLEEAVLIADEFLKDKKLIVFTKNKQGETDKTYATKTGDFENGKLLVLINENSASASEIIAGAIQDNDRGIIIGRRSFGKGLVQQELPFKDGSSVRLTTARYYTPTGRSIQKSYKKGTQDYNDEFTDRYQNGELYHKDSIKIIDTLKFKTPKGRLVYGGGGIVPDIFVPLETTKGNEIIPVIMQSGLVTNYVFKTIDKSRSEFEKLTLAAIIKKINSTDTYYTQFKNMVQQSDAYTNLDTSKKFIKRYLTAEFCRQILGEIQYYQAVLKDDSMIKESLKQ